MLNKVNLQNFYNNSKIKFKFALYYKNIANSINFFKESVEHSFIQL